MTTLPNIRLYRQAFSDGPWHEADPVILYPAGQIPEGACFSSVTEYEGIRLSLDSDDPTARLTFDDFGLDEEGVLEGRGTRIVVKSGNSECAPSPAYYSLRVQTSTGVWETLYAVEPKHFDWSYIHSLRAYLEERVHGMTYDLLKKRSGMWVQESQDDSHWFTVFRTLQKVFPILKRQLVLIGEHPLERLEKVYRTDQDSTHPDRKSQRWMARKGQRVNPNPHLPIHFHEKTSVCTIDNQENQWVLTFLNDVNRYCKEIREKFGTLADAKRKDQEDEVNTNQRRSQELEAFQRAPYSVALRKRIQDLTNAIRTSHDKRARLEQEVQRYQSTKDEVQQMIVWLSHTLHTGWLSEVTLSRHIHPSFGVRKDPRYGSLYRISRMLKDNVQRDSSARRQAYPHLSTNKLLEVYTVCVLCELLQEEGWDWEEGWVRGFGEINPAFCELRSGEEITFIREDGFRIQLAYDKKIPRNVEEGYVGFEAMTHHDMPDIRLALFDQNGVFMKAMVIEVKHRNYHYLVNPVLREQTTDVIEQLKGYSGIAYGCPHRNRNIREAVDRVVCVYPKQPNAPEFEERNRRLIRLIQFEPSIDLNAKPFGYDRLKHEIMDFVQHAVNLLMY